MTIEVSCSHDECDATTTFESEEALCDAGWTIATITIGDYGTTIESCPTHADSNAERVVEWTKGVPDY